MNLAEFRNATFHRGDGSVALTGVTWAWHTGQTWAITGPSGSGKTAFAEALAGRLRLTSGTATLPSGVVAVVTFHETSRRFSPAGHYYQQRYEFADSEERCSLRDYLTQDGAVLDDAILQDFELQPLLDLSFIKLSTGQSRRARIARALLNTPDVLILDDPFLGLDAESRPRLAALLGSRVSAGLKLLLICKPEDVPEWVTNTLSLRRAADDLPFRRVADVLPFRRDAQSSERSVPINDPISTPKCLPVVASQAVAELNNVTVRHGGRTILQDVNWTIRAGERWALVGPNGVGKTTLLALLVGDHPQAFSNDIRLFGRRRGSGETIWDVKANVGFVSPEFHVYFAEDLTAFEAAATGFTDTLLFKPVTPEEATVVATLFEAFGVAHWQDQRMRRLSMGQQRLALLIRALVKSPPLVVLDEPYQGLDTPTIHRVNAWLESQLTPQQTLIVTTHRPEELPAGVTLIKQLHLPPKDSR